MSRPKKPRAKRHVPCWPVKITPDAAGKRPMVDGETVWLRVRRFSGDAAARANAYVACCDCGLKHLHSFELFEHPRHGLILSMRSYRLNQGGPETRRKVKGMWRDR